MAEGLLLVRRAVEDRLPVEFIVCTPDLHRNLEGTGLLESVAKAGIPCFTLLEPDFSAR